MLGEAAVGADDFAADDDDDDKEGIGDEFRLLFRLWRFGRWVWKATGDTADAAAAGALRPDKGLRLLLPLPLLLLLLL